MTSNIGSHHLLEGTSAEGEINPQARNAVMQELRSHFRPEFLNRIDETVLFSPLTQNEIVQIVYLQLDLLRKRLLDQQISLTITREAAEFVAQEGYDPTYGARPLKRYIQRVIETQIGRAIIAGKVGEGQTVRISMKDGKLHVDAEGTAESQHPVIYQ